MQDSLVERAAKCCGIQTLHKDSIYAVKSLQLSKKLSFFFRTHLGLSKFSTAFALRFVQEHFGKKCCRRIMSYLLSKINDKRVKCRDEWQRGCPQIIPGLRASKFWDPEQFEWIAELKANFSIIRDEIFALRRYQMKTSGFQPYRAPSSKSISCDNEIKGSVAHDSGEWNIYYLYLHNIDFSENRDRVPETTSLLKKIPRFYNHAMVSNLAADTHVTKHHGPTNKKLRVHLPLFVPPGGFCKLRVGNETRICVEGRPVIFDDSFEHEAWNMSEKSRVVLIFDIWHPDLSDEEVKFLSFIQNAQLRAERKRIELTSSYSDDIKNNNLFSIIESNRSVRPDTKVLWKFD